MSTAQMKCQRLAIQFEDGLFPDDCIEILESVYKGKLEIMYPKTILGKVRDLMNTVTDYPCEQAMMDAVNNYICYV